MTGRIRRRWPGAAAVLLAVLLGAGCGGGSAGDGSASRLNTAQEDGGAAAGQAAPEEDAPEDGAGIAAGVEASDRDEVHTATLSVESGDVAGAAEQAAELVTADDGYVERQSVHGDGADPSASLTLRVPREHYEDALDALGALGERTGLEQSVTDVTEEVADVDSRVESAEASLERLRDMLADAESVEDLLAVEGQISSRQEELEALQARQAALGEQSSYGTVELSLDTPAGRPADDSEAIGFLGGLAYGWNALTALAGALATAAGWLLPFLAVALPVLAAAAWWRRRSGRSALPSLPWRFRRGPEAPGAVPEEGSEKAASTGD